MIKVEFLFLTNNTLLLGLSIALSLIFCLIKKTLLFLKTICFSPIFLTRRSFSILSLTLLTKTPDKEYLIFSLEFLLGNIFI